MSVCVAHSSNSQDITTTAQTIPAHVDIWRNRPDFRCGRTEARPGSLCRCLGDAASPANIRRHSLHSDLTFPTSTACSDTPQTKTEQRARFFGPPIPNLSVCVAHSSDSQDITTTAQTSAAQSDIWRKRPDFCCRALTARPVRCARCLSDAARPANIRRHSLHSDLTIPTSTGCSDSPSHETGKKKTRPPNFRLRSTSKRRALFKFTGHHHNCSDNCWTERYLAKET